MPRRSGTPVKLLGREDASVDWYNLEKSKRVKAFRCGEFDACIERAEAAQGIPIKKREKYARREDAILQALELEKQMLENQQKNLPRGSSIKYSAASKKELHSGISSTSYFRNNEPVVYGKYTNSKSQMFSRFFPGKSTGDPVYSQKGKDNKLSEATSRIRGLQDFGIHPVQSKRKAVDGVNNLGSNKNVPIFKKKKLQGDLTEDILGKRRDKRRPSVKVLQSSTQLPASQSTPSNYGSVPLTMQEQNDQTWAFPHSKRSTEECLTDDSNGFLDQTGHTPDQMQISQTFFEYHGPFREENASPVLVEAGESGFSDKDAYYDDTEDDETFIRGMELKQYKRMRIHKEAGYLYAGHVNKDEGMHSTPTGQSDPFALSGLLERLADGKYGSVTKEFESIRAHNRQMIHALSSLRNSPSPALLSPKPSLVNVPVQASYLPEQPAKEVVVPNGKYEAQTPSLMVCNEKGSAAPHSCGPNDSVANGGNKSITPVIIIDSDEEDQENQGEHALPICNFVGYAKIDTNVSDVLWRPSVQYEKVLFTNVSENGIVPDLVDENCGEKFTMPTRLGSKTGRKGRPPSLKTASSLIEDKETAENISACKDYCETDEPNSVTQNHTDSDSEDAESDDGLQDLWKEMSLATELSKDITLDVTKAVPKEDEEEECDHSYVLKDDLGLVCRICGIIQKSIEQIFDYQWTKAPRTTRTYPSDYRTSRDDGSFISGLRLPQHDLIAAEIAIHPRHEKQMKPHQLEGFSFLVRNLVSDKPGGCILAHAPGSGKTFMLISFIQSFLAKYPYARPLVILPKGILSTWKKEFHKWQVEEIPLYDFYYAKADSRAQQLEVLKTWEENKSILFLGYKQFANIVCECAASNVASACQERLLKVPSLLIIDEGHTPRNDNTDVLNSLSRVETPRKVVLSGTLFQNHVKEVFNILNLVRPHFLRMVSSRSIIRRIQSRVQISGLRKICRADSNSFFFDLVEDTLQNDNDFKRRATVIQDLREMTQDVLHYYKGDFLDELPGLVDFTVLLKVSAKQKAIMRKLGRLDKFKKSSVCSAIFIHPNLNEISENAGSDKGFIAHEDKLDYLTRSLDIKDGVKTNFFLNILSMSDSAGEKMLVFSHYLLPLKFLEKLTARVKGWRSGKEMFMILGDSTPEHREWSMEQFNNSPDAKVLFGSIKACGEGISLVGASRVVILDVHLNPSVSRQAIGRAFRPGQTKKVIVYRLVAADSLEEEDHKTSFRKELTSKMWFEWSGHLENEDFELAAVEIDDSQDIFLGNPQLVEDIKVLYKRIT